MKCIRCGNELKETDKFCRCCGQKVAEETQSNIPVTPTTNNTSSGNDYYDEELLKAFVGNNYDKLSQQKFNFAAFFLGPLYYLYRKLYLLALAYIGIAFIFSSFSLIIRVIIAVVFNEYYIKYAKKKIEDIRRLNPASDIQPIVASKGGTNIIGPVIGAIVYVLIVVALIAALIYKGIKFIEYTKENIDEGNTYKEELPEIEEPEEYIGEHIDDLYYTVPSDYQTITYNEYETGRYTLYLEKTICHFEVGTTNLYEREYFDYSKSVVEETINNIKYKLLEKTVDDNGQKIESSYYYTTYNKKNYIITFTRTNDVNNKCLNDQKEILDKIHYKVDSNTSM